MATTQNFNFRPMGEWAGMSGPWAGGHRHQWIKRNGTIGCMECGMVLGSHGLNDSYEGRIHMKRVQALIEEHCPTTGGDPDIYVTEAPFECIGETESEAIKQERLKKQQELEASQAVFVKEKGVVSSRQAARQAAIDRAFNA